MEKFVRYLIVVLLCTACIESGLEETFDDAALKQFGVDNNAVRIFTEDPEILAGRTIDFTGGLDNVPRQWAFFSGLKSLSTAVGSQSVNVQFSNSDNRTFNFANLAGEDLRWDDDEFKYLMGFYHSQKALEFVQSQFNIVVGGGAAVPFNFSIISLRNDNGPAGTDNRDQLLIRVKEQGSPGNTEYNFENNLVNFFQSSLNDDRDLNFIHTPHAIYHEFGHAIQYVFAPSIFRGEVLNEQAIPFVNHYIDSLFEGIADFTAAAMSDNDRILGYLDTNFKHLVGDDNINGNRQFRALNHDLRFPDHFTDQIHLDGRIVAAALNDLRKYVQGDFFTVSGLRTENCSPQCDFQRVFTPEFRPFSSETAFKIVFRAAHLALKELDRSAFPTKITYQNYSEELIAQLKLISVVTDSNLNGVFDQGDASAAIFNNSADEVNFKRILKSRGLISEHTQLADAQGDFNFEVISESSFLTKFNAASGSDAAKFDLLKQNMVFRSEVGYEHFEPGVLSRDLDEEGEVVSKCEAIVVYPNLVNIGVADQMDAIVRAKLVSITGNHADETIRNNITRTAQNIIINSSETGLRFSQFDSEDVNRANQTSADVNPGGFKPFGWFKPNVSFNDTSLGLSFESFLNLFDSTSKLITDGNSNFFTDKGFATLMRKPQSDGTGLVQRSVSSNAGGNLLETDYGWIIRAPQVSEAVVDIVFDIEIQVFNQKTRRDKINSADVGPNVIHGGRITQQLKVARDSPNPTNPTYTLPNESKFCFCESSSGVQCGIE